MTLQVVEPNQLKRLLDQIERKVPDVKSFLEAVRSTPENAEMARLVDLLALPRVKESQHMTAILLEIRENLEVGNPEGASAVARRVLEARPVPVSLVPEVRQHKTLESKSNE